MEDADQSVAVDARPRRLLRAAPTILFYLAAAFAAWFLWPSSLGGCTTLTIVSGHSMEPTYYTGDVVVARCGAPKVGDIVVYQPESMGGARIIHRIIGGDSAAGWKMKGDNNSFVDPFTPTNGEVLGIAREHLPKVGLVAAALTNPWIWVSLIAIAIALLLWPTSRDDEPDAPDAPDATDGTDGSSSPGDDARSDAYVILPASGGVA